MDAQRAKRFHGRFRCHKEYWKCREGDAMSVRDRGARAGVRDGQIESSRRTE
jgi:hypothetical protein